MTNTLIQWFPAIIAETNHVIAKNFKHLKIYRDSSLAILIKTDRELWRGGGWGRRREKENVEGNIYPRLGIKKELQLCCRYFKETIVNDFMPINLKM